jgi:hypothetical protein
MEDHWGRTEAEKTALEEVREILQSLTEMSHRQD